MYLIIVEWITFDDTPNDNTNPLPNLAIRNKGVYMNIDDFKGDKKESSK